MEFRILDRLEVIEHGHTLPLGGSRQRALLAMLLVHRRTRVSMDQLIDALWGECPPPTATKTIQVYVSRLRKTLGDGVVETRENGYRLAAEAAQVDADRFEALAHEGRSALEDGDARRAARLLTEALQLWRGPPLGEFLYEPFARGEISRLEAERVAAIEARLTAELHLGRGLGLVPELEQLVREHPLREGLVGALMLALYRAGRQADALSAYRAARQRLVDELGLEPGLELRQLERRILDHDPTLATRRIAPRVAARGPVRTILAVTAIAVAVVAVAGLTLGATTRGPPRPTLSDRDGLVTLSATSGRLLTTTALDDAPTAVSSAAGSVWAVLPGAGIVSRIAPNAGAALDRIAVSGEPGTIVAGGGAVWTASTVGATVERIDPTTGAVTQTVALPGSSLSALAMAPPWLWVADAVAHRLFAIDSRTGTLARTVALDVQPSALVFADGKLWVAGYDTGTLQALDPVSGHTVARVRVGDGPAALTSADGAVWVANSLDSTVSRVDPVTRTATATIAVGSGPSSIVAAGGSVWVASRYSHDVTRIDPNHNRVAAVVKVGGLPTALASGAGRVWVGVAADAASHRGGTLRIVSQVNATSASALGPPDPATYDYAFAPQFMGLAYDTLVTFQHTDGAAGSRLVPDLAVSLPSPTAAGRTYTFHIRPQVRYSDGRLLQPSDFRRALERLFRRRSTGASFFSGLVGAGQCERAPAACDLSRGVATDDARGTVTFHLTQPDPEFLFKFTAQAYSAPVPRGTPDQEPSGRSVPGTGPYTIVQSDRQQVRFVRNRYFREWAHAAQPSGNPDEIVWRSLPSAGAAVSAVQRGDADWFWGTIPVRRYRSLALDDPGALHISPTFGVEFVPLNTHIAPFSDVRVRRALNYAIDRHHIAELYGGSAFASPACQPLAPGTPGYRRYCPYTRRPTRGGVWSAADVARARRLVAASGTRGQTVDVWGSPDEGFVPASVPRYVASVLRGLGYRVRLHMRPFASITETMRRQFQISVDGDWLPDYPAPSALLPPFFGCRGGLSNGYVCHPALDRQMARAVALGPRNPAAANALWTGIDHRLTDDAAWVSTVSEREVEVTSARLGNYQYNPVWGFLADQSWVR